MYLYKFAYSYVCKCICFFGISWNLTIFVRPCVHTYYAAIFDMLLLRLSPKRVFEGPAETVCSCSQIGKKTLVECQLSTRNSPEIQTAKVQTSLETPWAGRLEFAVQRAQFVAFSSNVDILLFPATSCLVFRAGQTKTKIVWCVVPTVWPLACILFLFLCSHYVLCECIRSWILFSTFSHVNSENTIAMFSEERRVTSG